MAQLKGGKITIDFSGSNEPEEKESAEPGGFEGLKSHIENDDVINDFAKEQLLNKLNNGGNLKEVLFTYSELKKMGNAKPLMSKGHKFLGE
jgi:hypothetical protein